jgi:Mannosylglycerate hydrolase MGH1-like glycoside hydrolase domain/Glycosyl hydrolase family 63 C-terminal domain
MLNDDVISMPDKWEYPWFAAWDLAFHCVALSLVDVDFAKGQLSLLLRELYLHPNGQIPAYEWNFGDVNPPVHAWAVYFVYNIEKELRGEGDLYWLKQCFQKLLLNFTWWVNRKDPSGKNVFEGGFLGLDNIGIFDRSAPLPTGGFLEQADGTAWMALYSQNMLQLAVELTENDPSYEDMASKFAEHFFWIAGAMDRMGEQEDEMWDEEDGFFYDLLRLPDGSGMRLKVRSMVGLLPLGAATVFSPDARDKFPHLFQRARQFVLGHPELVANIGNVVRSDVTGRNMLSIVSEDKLRRILRRMLDPKEFLSDYGVRAISAEYRDRPFVLNVHGEEYRVGYLPAESDTGMFGGNSNWRGPIWVPVNILMIRALFQLYGYYGNTFKVECPTGSGNEMNLFQVGQEISRRLVSIFTRDANGKRPVYGGSEVFQNDPHWRDYILFYEYFHGDNGAGLGASHQTGWTGVVARLIQYLGYLTEEAVLEQGARAAHSFQKE